MIVHPCSAQPRRWSPLFWIVRSHDCQGLPPPSRTNGKHGQASRSRLVYQYEPVVIGPVNHSFSMEVANQSLCSNRVSAYLCSCSLCGSWKATAGLRWFTETTHLGLGALGKAATPFSKALQRECILPPITTRVATMTRSFAGFINGNE